MTVRRIKSRWRSLRRMAQLAGQLRCVARCIGRRQVVLVHQMGRVGSTSVMQALLERADVLPVHVHFLSSHFLGEVEWAAKGAGNPVPEHIYEGRFARWFIDHTREDMPVHVVTLVRDPVAFYLSDFFHNTLGVSGAKKFEADALARQFESLMANFNEADDYMTRWLDLELSGVHGVDALQEGFDIQTGWQVYDGRERTKVLVLRLEDVNAALPAAMDAAFGLAVSSPPRANATDARGLGAVYKEVQKRLALPEDVLDRVYGTRYAKTFYSGEEIAAMRQRWGVSE